MADDEASDGDEGTDEEQSFRERVEELREQREGEGGGPREAMGGGPGGPGGMGGGPGGGGNPFAQMMGGMMGGGPGAMGGGPGGGAGGGLDSETFTREMERVRDEIRDVTEALERIADALEDD
ncbi:MAG: hypothetical protein U5J98_00090 [Halobacteriales archaeon]|nr:hypothetical protein [Halobacteriales archaeon]